jgi:predicted ATPase/DNA-binding SARP family transcriptional activator
VSVGAQSPLAAGTPEGVPWQGEGLRFGLLGPLEVVGHDRPLATGGGRQRALLALLLLNAGSVVARERLIDGLWGEEPPETAVKMVQLYVSQLRKLLPAGVLLTRPRGYLVAVDPESVDLLRFERLVGEARRAEPGRAARLLAEALALWRGPALAEFDEPFARPEARRLDELRLAALEARISADLALGRHGTVVPELETLVGERPLRESLRELLMLALYRAGRQADALAVYRETRTLLVEELGLEPGQSLQKLEQAILRQDPSLEQGGPPMGELMDEALTSERHGSELPALPAALTPLVGRLKELAEVGDLLRRPGVRIVTVVGAGGTGKTRLALALAETRRNVAFVSLAPVQETALVRSVIAESLGLRDETAVVGWLKTREVLIVLDNFEHLLEAAPLVTELLTAAPGLQVLATSRSPLNLRGEHQYRLSSMPTADAADLFLERSAAVGAEVEPSVAVDQVCERLDCLPLAIELAAAHSKTLRPEQLLERLEHRLPLLVGGARDLPERQRTLRATIDWSYELLTAEERVLFVQLGVFAGGCTLEAAEEVCGASLEGLDSLIDNSLLQQHGDRFTMLETIREYAYDRLVERGEVDAIARRHAERFFALAEELAPKLVNVHAFSADAKRLVVELADIRAALRFALDSGQAELALRVATTLYRFWGYQGSQAEGLRWLDLALDRARHATKRERAAALRAAASLALMMDDAERGVVLAAEALGEYRALGDAEGAAHALSDLGGAWGIAGDGARARAFLTESVELFDDLKDRPGLMRALANLGELERGSGHPARAAELFTRALEIQRALPGTGAAGAMNGLAMLALERGDLSHARELLCAASSELVGSAEMGDANLRYAVGCVSDFAVLAAVERNAVLAGRLWGAVEAVEERLGVQIQRHDRLRYEQALTKVDSPVYEAALRVGRTLTIEQVSREALAEYHSTTDRRGAPRRAERPPRPPEERIDPPGAHPPSGTNSDSAHHGAAGYGNKKPA